MFIRDNKIGELMRRLLRPAFLIPALLFLLNQPSVAQLVIKLNPKTVDEFERYAQTVELQLGERWHGKKNFLAVEDDLVGKRKVLGGDFLVTSAQPDGHPQNITEGLIHDWTGTVYMPKTDMARVIDLLRDFDRHKTIYPEIADSRTIRQSGDETIGYWRIRQKRGIVPIVLNIEQEAHYKEIQPAKWICKAYARNITEVDTGLFAKGRQYPVGEGHGYLWRLYAYWSLESFEGGVLAECRTLSLSRDIPPGLAWAVGPYVEKMPLESLTSTLKQTRKAVAGSDH